VYVIVRVYLSLSSPLRDLRERAKRETYGSERNESQWSLNGEDSDKYTLNSLVSDLSFAQSDSRILNVYFMKTANILVYGYITVSMDMFLIIKILDSFTCRITCVVYRKISQTLNYNRLWFKRISLCT